MDNFSLDLDSAKAILSTYQQVNDAPNARNFTLRTKLQQKNKALAHELDQLKEKYLVLQSELMHRDKKLAHLNKELIDKASYASQLQEDFENAIYQLKRQTPC